MVGNNFLRDSVQIIGKCIYETLSLDMIRPVLSPKYNIPINLPQKVGPSMKNSFWNPCSPYFRGGRHHEITITQKVYCNEIKIKNNFFLKIYESQAKACSNSVSFLEYPFFCIALHSFNGFHHFTNYWPLFLFIPPKDIIKPKGFFYIYKYHNL